jgi:pilus assembly protein CpaC
MISGYIDKPEYSTLIIRIAEEYYPKVINAMTVGGVEQVLLHIKVMEVSRTKMRKLGFDFAQVGSGGSLLSSGASGFLSGSVNTAASPMVSAATGNITTATNDVTFGIVNGANAFLGVLRCLRQDNLLKINSEPDLVAISGEEARFNAGGQIPVPVPQSLGTTTIEWKNYGTMIKFVPIVLGNGKIRMDVNPEISDLDASRSYTFNGTTVPGIRTRFARTSVEMVAGQTLAIAGLVQYYSESFNYGLPWVSEIPYVGTLFRNVRNETNEIELLVLVTPELVESLDPNEVPLCGPGTYTTDPSDWELFAKGHIEVPKCCPNKNGNGQAPADGMIGSPNSPGQNPADSGDAKGTGSYNRNTPSNPNRAQPSSASTARDNPPGFIGPAGYDVVK